LACKSPYDVFGQKRLNPVTGHTEALKHLAATGANLCGRQAHRARRAIQFDGNAGLAIAIKFLHCRIIAARAAILTRFTKA
jgi:hypothetical protein